MASRDQRWVERALAGSQEAYRELLRRYQRPVFSIIVRMVKDHALAEDLAQDTFVKAFRALGSYDPDRKFSSWLFTIAHNTAIDHLRRRAPLMVPLETSDPGPDLSDSLPSAESESPEALLLRKDLARGLEQALRRLRPEYAEVLVFRFQEGLSYEEISEVTGLPLGTVKTHLYRARKALARRLGTSGWSPS
jgi:RNA polymerase sigma-70 factor (ECF subfamily)